MANKSDKPQARSRAAVLGGQVAGWAEVAGGSILAAGWRSISDACRSETDAARLAPWLPVLLGVGIIFYFAAPQEPSLMAACLIFATLAGIAFVCRARPLAFVVLLALVAVAAGFAIGSLRGHWVAHPVLTRATQTVLLTGFVESRDATDRSDRIVLRITSASGRGTEQLSQRVRVALRRGTAPGVGSHVELKARMRPLLAPTRPGGYDYALGGYFARLGATGFVLGSAKPVPAPEAAPLPIRIYSIIEQARRALAARILTATPGEAGAVAIALITGIRDQISASVNESMRISGLYHVLSISGLHMAIVTGVIFAFIRGGLALIPGLALRYPIKKWTALAALIGAFVYMVLAGADAPTLRSFVMIALVLFGVMFDRPAITLRTLAIAAFVVLMLTPEAVLNPGFQMSFAATLALVSIYQQIAPGILSAPPNEGGAVWRLSTGAGKWLLAGALTSLLAGLATTPYAAFHFQRLAPYGLIANVLAMPAISFVIMPMAVLGVVLIPFGYDALAWKAMGWGIDVMLAIARWVAELPGAEGRIPAFSVTALILATLGLLLLAIPVSRLKWLGVPLFAAAFIVAVTSPKPDVMIDAGARTVAVRSSDGKLSILNAKQARISAETWLASDGDTRNSRNVSPDAFVCDDVGCIVRLKDGTTIAVASRPEAFADDCSHAALVISAKDIPAACRALGIDRKLMATAGAVSLRHVNGEWKIETVRSPYADRPWYGRAQPADPDALVRFRAKADEIRQSAEMPLAPAGDIPVPEPDEETGEDDQ
ncbi:MAG TPA: ComEC/Rec2 family competence protein [Xanthobacteraceae bacterium]|nr:ComEC/Rec2 family competence protein [Xanthobacteraceae bacterium]